MLTPLFARFAYPVIMLMIGTLSGIYLQEKVLSKECRFECPKIPEMKCPAPTIQMQPFEVEKMKNIKGFTYSPQYSGNISIAGSDTTHLREIIESSIAKALKSNPPKKK